MKKSKLPFRKMGRPQLFDLSGRVAVITGGGGLLGGEAGNAIAAAGGIPVSLDIKPDRAEARARAQAREFGVDASAVLADITRESDVGKALAVVLKRYGRLDILINNAANDPKFEPGTGKNLSRLELLPIDRWNSDIAVGLTGAFLCSRIFGTEMSRRRRGVIINIASDLAVIAPDQRLYRKPGLGKNRQPAKPVTYSVVKHGLLGLTRYLATYWAENGIRVNALSPGGVHTNQSSEFVRRLVNLIPLGRMATRTEYHGAIVFLSSDASAYMTGQNLIVDGGRTCW